MAVSQKDGMKEAPREASVIVKPIGRFGGLDNIHLSLIVLILILAALLLVVSYSKPAVAIRNITNNETTTTTPLNCTYLRNGMCVYTIHNVSQVRFAAEKFIASYNNVNTSLSLLPYITNVSAMNISYLPSQYAWYVSVPAVNPASNNTFFVSLIISDNNLSHVIPLIQVAISPSATSFGGYVISKGVVRLPPPATNCSQRNPMVVDWFIDPYASASLNTLTQAISLQKRYSRNVTIHPEMLLTQSSENIASMYGLSNALALSNYVYCASKQPTGAFSSFITGLNSQYSGAYTPPSTLQGIASSSSLNITTLNGCLANSTSIIALEGALAQRLNVTTSPSVVTDCQYLSIPQTAQQAFCYANKALC